MRRSILLSALFAALAFAPVGFQPAYAGEEQHAEEGAEPGSYEDWCDEHKVPESQCTRCDKTLIPVFKATGDWCDKHGLPKSHDLKCDPDLKIVRPPKQEA
jgi:hypothetical protein